ncbi:protein SMAX1-LIKE 2-like [Impatiens glandulifera]|uniref:protein SMAX1-LIKE 2-like n=1 Tax=Impatiens glandulifera TaxID=253017 RepID=UPI001FB1959A|nr:protein SMAX1-LIKE 2-like [Impatiens glandulifera]
MMKSGLATIHQTLTLEPSVILNRSITEASRRNHAQTTPLHVAATLLSSPTGFLRQACLTSHPNSSHPLQCRALDLCFRVALERLPSAPHKLAEPPLSNALTAALKRAQAHQRRGCPENQQQAPLLAVKVELEQLIISILDDPSVSKVMREASFSSPAVKSAIERSMMMVNSSSPVGNRFLPPPAPPSPIANLYLSPRLKQGSSGEQRSDEAAKRVIEIMMRRKKRNPILVGDEEPAAILKEVVRRIEKEGLLKNAEVIPFPLEKQFAPEKNQIPIKIKELAAYLIESSRIRTSNNRGIVLDLGDLRWLVEETVSENGRTAVAEMRKLISSIGEEDGLWLIGTANCETYLRCQVYHASLERDWDVQAVPIAASKLSSRLLQGIIPSSRVGMYGNHNPNYINPLKRSTMALPALVPDKEVAVKCCPMCFKNYELDLKEKRNSSSASEVAKQPPPLPRWLQNAKAHTLKDHFKEKNEDDQIFMQKLEEQLQMKWSDKCSLVHPNFHHNLMAPKSPKYQPKLQTTTILGQPTLQLSVNLSPPASPVKTDLVLGTEKTSMDCINDCISSELLTQKSFAKREDLDLFKKLLKSLLETSWWQKQAASELATTVTQSRSRNGKRRDGATKGDLWLLFAGPDRISKKRMAYVVAEQICESKPIVVCLGVGSSRLYNEEEEEEEKTEVRLRGKTALDRIVEAVRKNPNSVIVLEDIDEADMLVRGSIKLAMERGRLTDSHGREISLGNIIFILTAKPPDELIRNVEYPVESKYGMKCNWQLQLSIKDRCNKRRANWLDDDDEEDDDRAKMPRTIGRHGLSLDLNLLADADAAEEDVVTECEEEEGIEKRKFSMTTVPHELTIHLDGMIVFKPVDFGVIRREIESRIKDCFAGAVGKEHTIELEGAAIEKLVGESWLGRIRFIDWMEKLLFPSFEQIRSRFSDERTTVVRLQLDGDCGSDQQGQVRLMALDDDDDDV